MTDYIISYIFLLVLLSAFNGLPTPGAGQQAADMDAEARLPRTVALALLEVSKHLSVSVPDYSNGSSKE